jgi:hypothetical protein
MFDQTLTTEENIEISKNFNAKYINLTDLEIQTTDGNHIWYKEVPKVTKELAKRL